MSKGSKRVKSNLSASSMIDKIKSLQNVISNENIGLKNVASTSSGFVPVLVGKFDDLIDTKGVELGDNIMISGGAGTGKSTFCLQSMYNWAKKGFNGLYVSFEEPVEKLKKHMLRNFGWDFEEFEKKGLVKFVQLDPFIISRKVESELAKARGELLIKIESVLNFIPKGFKPRVIVIDSLSALSAAFLNNPEGYRMYLTEFLKRLAAENSINLILSETEQNPDKYSRSGVEEFLVDAVVVLYNLRVQQIRQRAIEILKLRSANHAKKLVPYNITSNGLEIYPDGKIFI